MWLLRRHVYVLPIITTISTHSLSPSLPIMCWLVQHTVPATCAKPWLPSLAKASDLSLIIRNSLGHVGSCLKSLAILSVHLGDHIICVHSLNTCVSRVHTHTHALCRWESHCYIWLVLSCHKWSKVANLQVNEPSCGAHGAGAISMVPGERKRIKKIPSLL